MRWFAPLLLLMTAPVQAALIDASTDQTLCQAAVTESALPNRINDLMDSGRFDFADAGPLLSLECGDRTLLQAMVEERKAENLEYAVIDLGLDLNAPVIRADGATQSLVEWLDRQADSHANAEVRAFAASYLERFRDESYNPNLLVSAQ